jgi:hypothetical protein
MKELEIKELHTITGGSISATYLNAVVKAADLLYEIAKNIGSSIRRWASSSSCDV